MNVVHARLLARIIEFTTSVVRDEGDSRTIVGCAFDVGAPNVLGAVRFVFRHDDPRSFEDAYFRKINLSDGSKRSHTLHIDDKGYVVYPLRINKNTVALVFVDQCSNWLLNSAHWIADTQSKTIPAVRTYFVVSLEAYEAQGMIAQARFDNELMTLAKSSNEIPKEDR